MVVPGNSEQTALPLGDFTTTRPFMSPYVSMTKTAVLRFILGRKEGKRAAVPEAGDSGAEREGFWHMGARAFGLGRARFCGSYFVLTRVCRINPIPLWLFG